MRSGLEKANAMTPIRRKSLEAAYDELIGSNSVSTDNNSIIVERGKTITKIITAHISSVSIVEGRDFLDLETWMNYHISNHEGVSYGDDESRIVIEMLNGKTFTLRFKTTLGCRLVFKRIEMAIDSIEYFKMGDLSEEQETTKDQIKIFNRSRRTDEYFLEEF
jgi:hypothetical protein